MKEWNVLNLVYETVADAEEAAKRLRAYASSVPTRPGNNGSKAVLCEGRVVFFYGTQDFSHTELREQIEEAAELALNPKDTHKCPECGDEHVETGGRVVPEYGAVSKGDFEEAGFHDIDMVTVKVVDISVSRDTVEASEENTFVANGEGSPETASSTINSQYGFKPRVRGGFTEVDEESIS